MDDAASRLADVEGIELGLSSLRRSSWILRDENSPEKVVNTQHVERGYTRTRFSLRNYHIATFQDIFQLSKIYIALRIARCSTSGQNRFLDRQLDDQCLAEITINKTKWTIGAYMLTSVFEKRSLSGKSATPNSWILVSAKAMPTVR